jgi:hypothetical protein
MSNSDLDELAAELAEFAPPEKKGGRPASEERVIAGFEEIQRFTEKHGHAPQHGEDRDIFERLYSVRLDRLRALPDCRALLEPLDHQGLLAEAPTVSTSVDEAINIDDLAAELAGQAEADDITVLRHVRTNAEKRAAEEIAQRTPCADFDQFSPLFEYVRREIKAGIRTTRAISKLDELRLTEIQQGEFFIVDGQFAYIAQLGDEIRTNYERRDSRLRVIYDNGTESDVLQRSFQRALYRDEAARLVTNPSAGPLFSDEAAEDDLESGTIYVLRSLSSHPYVSQHRELIHKIGVTGGKIETRISNASHDATYLLADVEVVATYKLVGVNRTKLEGIFHRIFVPAQLDLVIHDRFGHPVRPREWFLVPLHVIDEAVKRIVDGTITKVIYDPKAAQLVDSDFQS